MYDHLPEDKLDTSLAPETSQSLLHVDSKWTREFYWYMLCAALAFIPQVLILLDFFIEFVVPLVYRSVRERYFS